MSTPTHPAGDYPVRHCSRCRHPLAVHQASIAGVWGECLTRGCDCKEAIPGDYYAPRDIVPIQEHERRRDG